MIAIVQARFNSNRLPGKVLKKLMGKSILQRTLERLSASKKLTKILIGTSNETTDDQIADYCSQNGWPCHRGDLVNVAQRFAEIISTDFIPAFVRISADSPFIDPNLVDQAVQLYENSESDLVTNVLIRTFPKGQSLEVLRSETFLKTLPKFDKYDQEHVTPYFYRHLDKFRITAFTSGQDAGICQLSIDTQADFEKIESMLKSISGNPGNWEELWRMSQQFER